MKMQIIEQELNIIREKLLEDFIDPFETYELREFLMSGSKLIRSSVAILYLKLQNIEINDDIRKILLAGEFIHNASLLHDDVIDDAEYRRNKKTISKITSPKISILAGDYLLSNAISKLLELKKLEILQSFEKCTKKMPEAEIKQFFLREILPTEKEYINICKGKTASLFSAILESCAILLGLDAAIAKEFGEKFGICFQINNDLNKDSAEIDIKNGIYTANDVLGIEKTNILLDNFKGDLRDLISNFPNNEYKEELEGIINLL